MRRIVRSWIFALVLCTSACGDDGEAVAPVEAPTAESAESPPAPPAPTPGAEPCRVELEHTFRDVEVSDDAWKTVRVPVTRFVPVAELDSARHDVSDWTTAPIAPEAMSATEFRAQEGVTEGPSGTWQRTLADSSVSYTFDSSGRTTEVDFDPVADSSVYRFHYTYDCE